MTLSRRNTRFPRSSARRKTGWSLGPRGTSTTVSSTGTVLFATGTIILLDAVTLIRTRGQLVMNLETADAAGSGFEWAFGMCFVNENAASVGVTAVPDPVADIAWDGWFVYETGTLLSRQATAGLLDAPSQSNTDLIRIDSKAMRKTHISDVAFGVLGVTELGTSTMRAFIQSRMLFKLP